MADRKTIRLLCNCQKSFGLDGAEIAAFLGEQAPLTVHSELCRGELAKLQDILDHASSAGTEDSKLTAGGIPTVVQIACRQEAGLFREMAQDADVDNLELRFTDIRDASGWLSEAQNGSAKIAALLAAGLVDDQPAPSLTLVSDGICLVYGHGQAALDAARRLGDRLPVSVLLIDADDALPPASIDQPIHMGRIARATGHLGAFDVTVDGYADVLPSSKDGFAFAMPRDGAKAQCHVIIDLSGEPPLFPAGERRDGYLRADPDSPADVLDVLFKASDLVGEFEKPRYVSYDASICAHSRSDQTGCTNCLDVCPVSAIAPNGDGVHFDAAICGGCGNCASVCPTGAANYTYPQRGDVLRRMDALLATYLGAGGEGPIVLLSDEAHGPELINAMARFGRGLPPNVLPLSLPSVLSVGHEVMAGAIALGAERVIALAPPTRRDELGSMVGQVEIAEAFLSGLGYGSGRVQLLDEADPDAVEAMLYELAPLPATARSSAEWVGTKRDVARTILGKLHSAAPEPVETVPLPETAPYGRIVVDTEGCTLCLSCVGACPANALSDHPERPQLSFTEAACVQCGVCVATCPESVIKLEARYSFATEALSPATVKTEEPFHCVECGKAFGTKATVERVVDRLKGHSMFQDAEKLRLIQMCDDCRIVTQATGEDDPFRGGDRPVVRTTDDYLKAEERLKEKARQGGKLEPDDFLS
ncbi:MAG: 4Fe-4S dicluster domain-containing protein [Pseudomonadota bacterium]